MSSRRRACAQACLCAQFLLGMVVAGCGGSSSGARSCRVDADCASGATCQSGLCQAGLRLALVSPTSGVATRGALAVQVDVSGGSPPEVQLVLDGQPLVRIGPPYAYAWDTTTVPEGSHELWARVQAGSATYESAHVQVVTDRTAPGVPVLNAVGPTGATSMPVTGTAEPGATVTLYEGTTALGSATASASGAFSLTLAPPDGAHPLTATATDAAGNVSASSGAVTLIVDRTWPTVVGRVPAPSPAATNVWWRDPVTVTFSKPMAKATVESDAAVQLVGAGGATMAKTLSLSGDGLTLTIRLAGPPPAVTTPPTVTVTATLNGSMTDMAGNPLVPPADVWSWQLPVWQDLASPIASGGYQLDVRAAVVVAEDGTPAVAIAYVPSTPPAPAGAGSVSARLWAGSAWTTLPDPTTSGSHSPVIDVDRNKHVAFAWTQGGHVLAGTWNGTAWVGNGNALDGGQGATSPSVRIDGGGRAVVAWLELGDVHVKGWNGAWVQLGSGVLNSTNPVTSPVASVDGGGNTFVSWMDGTAMKSRTWSPAATSWNTETDWYLGGYSSVGPWVGASGSSRPFTAWIDSSGTVPLARVSQLAPPSGNPALNNIGQALNVDPTKAASSPAIALDAAGRPVVVWLEGTAPSALYVKRWDGSGWQPLGGNVDTTIGTQGPRTPSVAVGRDGTVVVLWTSTVITAPAPNAYNYPIYAMRYNR
jgi:hypothetical protein